MKKIRVLTALACVAIMALATACTSAEEKAIQAEEKRVSELTALEVVDEMGNGWNLGNTMEATGRSNSWSPTSEYETRWGQPITTKEMIDGVKEAGFDSVRIPVAWSNMILAGDDTYTIREDYLIRVGEIIDYVLDNDMCAIINIHWDGGWWDDFGSADVTKRENAMKKYIAMWTQISEYYKDYSYKLIFESANEELGATFNEALTEDECYAKTNEINQKFVDVVRSSGGKNDKRFLLIAGYNTDFVKTCDDRYIMPTDTIENHLILSVHYYTPSTFCIASSADNSWGYMGSWGTEMDKAEMRQNFEKLKKFTDKGYGVIIGEYGVIQVKIGTEYVNKEGTDLFIQGVVELSEEMGYCPMLWDANCWYNKHTCEMSYPEIAEIFKKSE